MSCQHIGGSPSSQTEHYARSVAHALYEPERCACFEQLCDCTALIGLQQLSSNSR